MSASGRSASEGRGRLVAAAGAAALALSIASPAAADGWLVRIGVGAGGDDLYVAPFDNGDTETITAGDGLFIEGGLRRAFVGPDWDTDLTVGYTFDSIDATNGDVSFNRVTLNALQFYRVSEQLRVGAGVSYHLGPELDIDVPRTVDPAGARTIEFDDALGFVVAVDYRVNERFEIGLRAVQIDYETNGAEVGGDAVGVYLGFAF